MTIQEEIKRLRKLVNVKLACAWSFLDSAEPNHKKVAAEYLGEAADYVSALQEHVIALSRTSQS